MLETTINKLEYYSNYVSTLAKEFWQQQSKLAGASGSCFEVTKTRIYICASRIRVDFIAHKYMRVAVKGLIRTPYTSVSVFYAQVWIVFPVHS